MSFLYSLLLSAAFAQYLLSPRVYDKEFYVVKRDGDSVSVTWCMRTFKEETCNRTPTLTFESKQLADFSSQVLQQCMSSKIERERKLCGEWIQSLDSQIDGGIKAWQGGAFGAVHRIVRDHRL